MRRSLCALAAMLAGLGLGVAAHATPPAAIWFGESLVCRRDDGAACELWLDADGGYTVFYDRGRPAIPVGPDGPFRFSARSGRYAAAAGVGGIELCLRPDLSPASPASDDGAPALFRDRGCLTLPVRPIGEPARIVFAGRSYTLLLVQGR